MWELESKYPYQLLYTHMFNIRDAQSHDIEHGIPSSLRVSGLRAREGTACRFAKQADSCLAVQIFVQTAVPATRACARNTLSQFLLRLIVGVGMLSIRITCRYPDDTNGDFAGP
jgi:hypothetical protein